MQTPGLLVSGGGVSKATVEHAVGYAKAAEQRGFHSCLVTEVASDALSLAQHVATATSRIQVGTGIFNIFLRPPLLAALQALTINAIAPGRLFLGLGTSHGPLNQAYGLPMDKPLTALRMYVHTLNSVFRGEHEGLTQLAARGMAIGKPETKIPIALAGVSPKSLQLTGEVADVSIPTPFGATMLKEVVDAIAAGAKRAGRSTKDIPINPIVHTLVCNDRDAAIRSAKQHLSFYASLPFYNRVFARHGMQSEAEQVLAAAMKGDMAGAAASVSERLIDTAAVVGTAQECAKKVEAIEKAGASRVILYPMAMDGDYDRGVKSVLDAFGR
ncbi:MAG: LLM class flavin-dependent oxidoreductase [Deltaproteobacteria bacterium]|nr:LLM class flavin-dependent oxidoreductase [Deltaproteobacteria bacterium]